MTPRELQDVCRALASKLPARAYFCGITAAALVGVPLPRRLEDSGVVHVAVPSGKRTLVGRGVRGHTYQINEPQFHRRSGLLITSPGRLWCELAVQLDVPDQVAAGDYLIHWRAPLTTVTELARAVELNPDRRGRRVLASALPLLDERSESPQESKLRVILHQGGLRGWVANLPITTRDGSRFRADLALPDLRVVIEYQSSFHEGTAKFRRDMTRISKLQADGWYVIQINADDLRDPRELVARIRDILATRR